MGMSDVGRYSTDEIISLLLDDQRISAELFVSTLEAAASKNRAQTMMLILSHGARNPPPACDNATLVCACEEGHTDTIR